MTRLSLELPNQYLRKFIWWMECDTCQQTRSRPAWSQQDLPLTDFVALGWECGQQNDKCPTCVNAAIDVIPPMPQWFEDAAEQELQTQRLCADAAARVASAALNARAQLAGVA